MADVLAIGAYGDADSAALTGDFGARIIAGPAEIDALADADRAGIRALAYKSSAPLDAAVMDRFPNLRGIANFGVGYDAIDIDAATARGITVTNTPDVLNDDVADLAVALLLAQSRGLEAGINAVRSGGWAQGKAPPLARKVSGRRIGILGLGRIGREIADRLAAFKCEIHYQSRGPKDTPGWTFHPTPQALAGAVDDLIVALVGGPDTEGMVSAGVLAALGPDGVLVNISRGSVVDEAALIAALDSGGIRGAALDVFRGEPKVDPRLAQAANVLPLPHIGSATVETRAAMGALQRRNLRALLDGVRPETPVN